MTSSMLDATVYADLYHGFLTQVFFTYLIINWTLLHEQCGGAGFFLTGSGSRLLKSLQSKNINLTVDFKKICISKALRAVKK